MDRKFWIITLIAFINSLSFTILIPIIYLYAQQFGLTAFQISFIFSIYSVTQFIATPVIGKLSDRFGRKPLLVISLTGTVIANLLAGTATSAIVLFLARFLDGITGGNNSVAQAVISDVSDPENRAKAFGIYGAAAGSGFILGPAISLLAQQISLGASFLVSSVIALFALLVTIFFLPETLKHKGVINNIFDIGIGNLITGLAMPKIGILLIINFCIGTTFTIFTFAFQPYFIYNLRQNSQSLTLMFVLIGVLGLVMQTLGIRLLTKRLNIIKILFLALFVRSLAFVLMPVWPNIVYFVLVIIMFAIFNSLVQPMINTLISLNARPEDQGTAMGLNASYLSIANAIGPIIAGMLINQNNPQTYNYSLYLAGILTFLVLVLAVLTRNQYAFKEKTSV